MNKIFFSTSLLSICENILCTFLKREQQISSSMIWRRRLLKRTHEIYTHTQLYSIRDKLMIVTILIRYKSWQSLEFIFFISARSFNFIVSLFLLLLNVVCLLFLEHYAHKLREIYLLSEHCTFTYTVHTHRRMWKYFYLFIRTFFYSLSLSRRI